MNLEEALELLRSNVDDEEYYKKALRSYALYIVQSSVRLAHDLTLQPKRIGDPGKTDWIAMGRNGAISDYYSRAVQLIEDGV
jgi:hypothetical protein